MTHQYICLVVLARVTTCHYIATDCRPYFERPALQFASGRRVVEFPQHLGKEGIEMVDDTTLADVQSLTVLAGFLTDRDVNVAILDSNRKREYRAPRGFPIFFCVQRTEAVITEEKAGLSVLADVLVTVFVLLADEILAAHLRGRLRKRGAVREFEKIRLVEQHAVLTAPCALVDALEGQSGVELDDDLFARVDLDALRWLGGWLTHSHTR